MVNNTTFSISLFDHKKDIQPKDDNSDYLVKLINNPKIGNDKNTNQAFAPTKFNGTRNKANAIEATALVLDYDSKGDSKVNLDKTIALWASKRILAYVYTTHSHTDENHCFRVVIPLKEPIPKNKFALLWNWAFNQDQNIDKSCKDISRMFFLPMHKQNAPYRRNFLEGNCLDWKTLDLEKYSKTKQTSAKEVKSHTNHTQTELKQNIWNYISKLPKSIEGNHGHNDLARVAFNLVQGFGLSINEARPYFYKWNGQFAIPQENQTQLEHKLSDALKAPLKEGQKRGWLNKEITPKDKKFDDLDFAIEFTNTYTNYKFDEKNNCWRKWIDTHWAICESREEIKYLITHIIRDTSPTTSISAKKIESVLSIAQTRARATFQSKNSKKLINFENGTLDLESNKLNPHNENDFLTGVFPYSYDQDFNKDNCKKIIKFLRETLKEKRAIENLVTHIGLALIQDTTFHKAILLLGKPRSGKTTALALVNLVCGLSKDDAFSFASGSLFDRASEGNKARVTWNDKPIVCIDELPVEALKNEETFKCMVAHSGVGMRQIYKEETINNRFKPKLIFTTNDIPILQDFSKAMSHRLFILDCNEEKKNTNKKLLDSLLPELGSFANISLRLAKRAIETGDYPHPDYSQDRIEEISLLSNPVKRFVKYCCISEENNWISNTKLYEAFKAYCIREGINPINSIWLTRKLLDLGIGYKSFTKDNVRGIQGIKLLPDYEDPLSHISDENKDKDLIN